MLVSVLVFALAFLWMVIKVEEVIITIEDKLYVLDREELIELIKKNCKDVEDKLCKIRKEDE